MSSGYSGTPLAQKLGVKTGQRTWRYHMPESVADEIEQSDFSPELLASPRLGLEMAQLFVTRRAELAQQLNKARKLLVPNGMIWVSWPKKSAKVATDITEDVVREEAFPLGLVDIKVCAVDAVWSGLKLVIRKSER